METVTNAVENMIGDAMPERFGLVLDEWTHGTEHYITVYGCFETATSSQYPLLSLAPVMDEPDDQLNAEDHIAVIKSGWRTYLGAANRLRQPPPELGRASLLQAHSKLCFISAEDEELSDFLPSRSAHRKLETLLPILRDIESVSKHLQGDGLTLLDARVLFDELLKSHPSFTKYLTTDADIVHSAVFEQPSSRGLVVGGGGLLTDDEAAALEPVKRKQTDEEGMAPADKQGFAVRTLKRRNIVAAPTTYELLQAIPPTSNMVERLFSVTRAVLCHERHRLSP
ncbi:hypothetical protein PR003_g20989 [Phytophthora rubi]|uniref:HAT C-terminal dimerisation domain-containing protein n=1 Tax=Phytophthora rubi TaxID=129364 RepID=A0A6A4DTR0_9STRA|nr:hypothetical protein PR003_g20989 [Phytophthora rubi]